MFLCTESSLPIERRKRTSHSRKGEFWLRRHIYSHHRSRFFPQIALDAEVFHLRNRSNSQRGAPLPKSPRPQESRAPPRSHTLFQERDPSPPRQPSSSPPPLPRQPSSSSSSHQTTGVSSGGASHIDVQAIIEATVAQVMAARPTESRRKTRRSQETKPGSPAYDRKLKKAALDNLSESGEKDWKVCGFSYIL